MLAAFVSPTLPDLLSSRLPSQCASRSRRRPVSLSLGARVQQRAAADVALLRDCASRCGQGAAAALAAIAIAGSAYGGVALADVPATVPDNVLYDDAGVVQKGTESLFEKAMEKITAAEGFHVRFVMAKSLPFGDSPDDYASELFTQWGLSDNDVLLVASPKLARAGAKVGSNVAPRLTPEIVSSLCNETYALKAGDESYSSAILDVSNRLIPVLGGRSDPGPPDMSAREVVQTYKTKQETSNQRSKYVIIVAVVLVIAFVAPLLQTYWYVKDD